MDILKDFIYLDCESDYETLVEVFDKRIEYYDHELLSVKDEISSIEKEILGLQEDIERLRKLEIGYNAIKNNLLHLSKHIGFYDQGLPFS